MRHVEAHGAHDVRGVAHHGQENIGGPSGQIEEAQIGSRGQLLGHFLAPDHVAPHGQQAIEEIVTRRNTIEHPPNVKT